MRTLHLLLDVADRLRFRPILASWLLIAGLAAAVAAPAMAPTVCAAAEEEDEDELEDPQPVSLKAGDGMDLKATYYAGWKEKESNPENKKRNPEKIKRNPVILLHAFKGNRNDLDGLAQLLQENGYAVLALDLRGHGESTKIKRDNGKVDTLTSEKLKPVDFANMVTYDVEAAKGYLMAKNNSGECNIEALSVVGVEMGAVVGLNWAAVDWSWPDLASGKQGKDVKALVMISPEWGFKALKVTDAMKKSEILRQISVLLIAGSKGKATTDTNHFHQAFVKYHPTPDDADVKEKQDLFLRVEKTPLQGTELLNEPTLDLQKRIAKFLELRIADKDFSWSERKNPLE